jgi:hypothetical protein
MKKIVFVEKQEGSYDPVVNFFNKKAATPSITNKTGGLNPTNNNVRSNTSKKIPNRVSQVDKPALGKK